MSEIPGNALEFLNQHPGGYNAAMGLRFVDASADGVTAEIEVGEQHLQPYGLVHGGVYAGLVETLCSVAAMLSVTSEGKSVVGLENTTSFIRAVRSGKLRARATPLHRGQHTHVWRCEVQDERDRLVAAGRLRLMVLDQGAVIAGEEVTTEGQTVDDRRPGTEESGLVSDG
jgi:1,4-dihydroxy-2-naphthoyl-CoA hydrolase